MPSYLVLARKYRPATFSDVVGQDHVIRTLSNSICSGRVAHAFLFCGVRGVGKTTVARILAKALNCSGRPEGDANPCNRCTSCKEITAGISVDVQEIDGASNTSVDNIREINENIKYPPVSSPYKIIIIDEVHMISINAFNALLKTLEEPPPHAKFIFATTESHKVPATINSRCQRFNFRTISLREILDGMAGIMRQEGLEATEDALAMVAREAQGSFRDALSLLDQVVALGGDKITANDVSEILGIGGRDCFGRLMGHVLDRDAAAALGLVNQLFKAGYDPEQFALDMVQYIRNLIVFKLIPSNRRPEGMVDLPPSEEEEMEQLVPRASAEEFQNLFGILLRSEGEIKRSANPWVALEMMILKMSYAPDIVNLSRIIQAMDSEGCDNRSRISNDVPRQDLSRSPAKVKPTAKRRDDPLPEGDAPRAGGSEKGQESAAGGFTITRVTPIPVGTPDEVWSDLKQRIAESSTGAILVSLMDHGNLISFGPTEVEIGFNKPVYRDQFERGLTTRPELRNIFEEFFGGASLKIMTLAQETSLDTRKPYGRPQGNETDLERALKHEAMENPVIKAVLGEFEGSYIEDIRISTPKP